MKNNLYITGLHGSSEKGLGKFLKEEHDFDVLEINSEFDKLTFDLKINNIQESIKGRNIIIATSLGAYLLLNALTIKTEARILLLSPVLGMAMVNGGGRIPPNFNKFKELIKNKALLIPNNTKLVSGEADVICPVGNIKFLQSYYPTLDVTIISNGLHSLDNTIIQKHITEILL